MSDIRAVTHQAGGTLEVARRIGISPQAVCNWGARGRIPEAHVIAWCRAVGWARTPHDIAPHLYPNKRDGMPRRRVKVPA